MVLLLLSFLSPSFAADPPLSTVEAMAKQVAFNLQANTLPTVNGDKIEYRRQPMLCPVGVSGGEILLSVDHDGRRTLVVFATIKRQDGPFEFATVTIGDRDIDGIIESDIGCGCDDLGVITQTKLYADILTCALQHP